jgi:ankyrin repeat protein
VLLFDNAAVNVTNSQQRTPLIEAVVEGHINIVKVRITS